MESLNRYFIELAFRGTAYHGWQIQQNAISVQQLLNEKLSLKLREDIYCVGCGRTDTGVHARQFYLHFDTTQTLPDDFIRQMNTFLPPDIFFRRIIPVPLTAHARFSAISRTYTYILSQEKDPFMLGYCGFFFGDLDVQKMNDAAAVLLRYSDFQALCKISTDQKTTLCTISHAQWQQEGSKLIFTISANRFLRGMVRIVVGTLLEAGKGKIGVQEFEDIIAGGNRTLAGSAAPADGLYLSEVRYPESLGL